MFILPFFKMKLFKRLKSVLRYFYFLQVNPLKISREYFKTFSSECKYNRLIFHFQYFGLPLFILFYYLTQFST